MKMSKYWLIIQPLKRSAKRLRIWLNEGLLKEEKKEILDSQDVVSAKAS